MPTVNPLPRYLPRALDIAKLLRSKSHLLLGPRQTGKSSLIRNTLPNVRVYNLLDQSLYLELSQRPARLREELSTHDRFVVIDEIQRIPDLLNEVQLLIEERGIHFLLTGSSTRRLRRGGVNLLGGRLRSKHLHPLTAFELGTEFVLQHALERGLLPSIYFSDDPDQDLKAYAGDYLQQEIAAEGATRNLPAFSRFLRTAALCNATVVNFSNIANDAQVPRTTVYEYFEILKETLILQELPAWGHSIKRKPIVSSKYYFFDIGVARILQNRTYSPGTQEYGDAFESYLHHEITAYADYRTGESLAYWRSTSGFEVDFILGDHTAIEVKAKHNVSGHDLKGLHALADEKKFKKYLCVSLESRTRTVDGIDIVPLPVFLKALWQGAYSG